MCNTEPDLVLSGEVLDLMFKLSELIVVGQVGGPQPAALLLQLIQLMLHVIPLLLCADPGLVSVVWGF